MGDLLVRGMHGLGDNLHQRAVLRALQKRGHQITLETSWPCVYADIPDIRFVRRPVALRTQLKNAEREAAKFVPGPAPHHPVAQTGVAYNRNTVGQGTILQAMFKHVGIPDDYAQADFSYHALPEGWEAPTLPTDKPVMVYRPLVVRPEWRGSGIRNANPDQYAELVALIRDAFFVVSVADLEPNREWIVGPRLIPDMAFEHGELPFESLAALFKRASLVFTSSGFPAILGPAVGTPTICVQGGFEPASWHADGGRFAPYLGIDTLSPCVCATSACTRPCPKTINMAAASAALRDFTAGLGFSPPAESRPLTEIFSPAAPTPRPTPPPVPRIMPRITKPVRPGHPSLLNRRPPVRA